MLNKVIIYGIGNSFKEYFEDADFIESGILTNGMDVVGVCDGNREYFVGGGTEVAIGSKKYIVQDISEFEQTTIDFILITSKRYFNEIKEDLVDKGIDGGKICLLIDFVRYKLFRESTYKYKLSLVLIIRDEAEYIKEWIEYHRLAGAEHFYIYDDESSDGLCDRIKDYIEKGIVTYIPWSNADQRGAYKHAVQNFKWDSKYMGFIDADEFIVSIEQKMLPDVIEEIVDKYEKNPYRKKYLAHCGGIGINWRMYGTSNHKVHVNGLVIENYMYRADDDYYENVHIKSIVNPRVVVDCSIHKMLYMKGFQCISENGSCIPDSFFFDSKYHKLCINHYYCKSEEDLLKKFIRGWTLERIAKKDISMSQERMEAYTKKLEHIKKAWNKNYDPIMKDFIPLVKKALE